MSPNTAFDESTVNRTRPGVLGAGEFAAILKGEIADATVLTRRTSTANTPIHDLLDERNIANDHLQDFTEQYPTKEEWAAVKRSPELRLAHAGLDLAQANAQFRVSEKIMANEVLRHAVEGVGDTRDQMQHQDNLVMDLQDKQGNRLRRVREFGGDSAVEKVLAESAADVAEMKAVGADTDDRCYLFYTAKLADAQLRFLDLRHRINRNRVPGPRTWTPADVKDLPLHINMSNQIVDATLSIVKATEDLFPYNNGL